MLRDELKDLALSLAKEKSHEFVEPRHVWNAIARYFRAQAEVQNLLPKVKSTLGPHGSAVAVPTFSPEALDLLATCKSDNDAVTALLRAFGDAGNANSGASGSSATATDLPPSAANASPSNSTVKPPATERETTAAVLGELDALIGLQSVKQQVRRLIAVVQANEERQKAGLAPVNAGLHLVFTGPPGTGKTTVARMIARLYAATGALPGKNFAEASRVDMVAGYVGQTALKTADIIKRATPGVLFIDEAYALTPARDGQNDYGAEAIATLVKSMEDDRKRFAVIVAGYDDEMRDFVNANPGLRSRFTSTINFPNYSAEELSQIFSDLARGANIGLQQGVLEKTTKVFTEAASLPSFGNARFARTLFEDSYARMSERAASDGRVEVHELMEITPADIHWESGAVERNARPIGFRRAD